MTIDYGIHEGLSFETYLDIDAASAHRLEWVEGRHEAYCYWRMNHAETLTAQAQAARDFGSAMHCAILEPDELDARYCVRPDGNANSKAFKEEAADLRERGYTLLSQKHIDGVKMARDNLYGRPSKARALIEAATHTEVTYYAHDPGYDVPVKCRPDALIESIGMRISVKTTADASHDGFGRQLVNLGYHRAEAFYSMVQEIVEPGQWRSVAFLLIENTPPYCVAARELDPELFRIGYGQMLDLLERYARCVHTGEWPAFSDEIETQTGPAWAYKETT